MFFTAHGITRYTRIVTDSGSCYRAHAFARAVTSFAAKHQRIKPFTPKHNGKVERCWHNFTFPWNQTVHQARGESNIFKQWRGLATRYDKLALTYRGGVVLRAITIWLRQ